MDYLREKVSGDKKRLIQGEYNLDLSYITPRIIAMAFPASGIEKMYRNSINNVSKFIIDQHADHFKVINISNRKFDYSKFNNKVEEYKWIDHHAPPIILLFTICQNILQFLKEDIKNVIIVNCIAGKGRTGTIICCFLLYSGLFSSPEEVFKFYSMKRFKKGQGVTQPSQCRYVKYFYKMLTQNHPFPHIINISGLSLYHPPKNIIDKLKPYLQFYSKNSDNLNYTNKENYFNQQKLEIYDKLDEPIKITNENFSYPLIGDITIMVYNNQMLSNHKIGRISFNTSFIDIEKEEVEFSLREIDPDNLINDMNIPRDFKIIVHYNKIENLCKKEECNKESYCDSCKREIEEEKKGWNTALEIIDQWRKEVRDNQDKDFSVKISYGEENTEDDEIYKEMLKKKKLNEEKNKDEFHELQNADDTKEDELNKSGECSII